MSLLGELRVIDLSSGQAGGIATMVLSDFGADVIKVERPGGDPARSERAAPMWLRGKRSMVLDLERAEARRRLAELAAGADVVLSTYRPGVASRLGADYETLGSANPSLIYCSITGFGPTGPYAGYRGYESVVAAKSGRMLMFEGQVDRDGPAYAAVPVGTHVAAQSAISAIVAALIARERDGRGQLVETSLLRGMVPFEMAGLLYWQLHRRDPASFPALGGRTFGGPPRVGFDPYPAADGTWIQFACIVEHLFDSLIAALGLTEERRRLGLLGAPADLDPEPLERLRELVAARIAERGAGEWMELFVSDGNVAADPWLTTQQALDHPQIVHNGEVVTLRSPRLGETRQLGPLASLPETPGAPAEWYALPGEHQDAAWRERPAAPPAAEPGEPSGAPPLDGVTVLEFASVVAVPFATTVLADLGARVIKVEPVEGDSFRGSGSPGAGTSRGLGSLKTTAGKESICVDLKSPEGRRIVDGLVERSDVLVHNFRPGAPERLGIGYEQVAARHPRLVYVSAMGYGTEGPHARRPTAHPGPGALLGGAHAQAGGRLPAPRDIAELRLANARLMQANEFSPDLNAGAVVASAALLGLYALRTRGVGQHIRVTMLGANAYANADDFLSYAGKEPRPLPDPELLGLSALHRLYRSGGTRDEGGAWVFLACPTEREWSALAGTPGFERLASDPRFQSADGRRLHDAELAAALGAVFATRSAEEWEGELCARDVACVRADGATPGLFWESDPHVRSAGITVEATHPLWGSYRRYPPLQHLARTPESPRGGGLGGQHARALLEELRWDPREVDALFEQGVLTELDR
ncbi:MAG: CoA transferase [Chloroflexi bacterium]|nr:CoA transferase [Chloroflexota bacterium]